MLIFQIILFVFAAAMAAAMSIADLRARIIPDVFLFPFLLAGLLLAVLPFGGFAGGGLPWVAGGVLESVIAGCIGYGLGIGMSFMFKLRLKSEERRAKVKNNDSKLKTSNPPALCALRSSTSAEPIGMGDIKLLAAGGIWMGVTGLAIALIASCAFGYIWGLCRRQKYIPFAPFFFIGGTVAIAALLIV